MAASERTKARAAQNRVGSGTGRAGAKQLSRTQRLQMFEWADAGVQRAEIARRLGCSPATVTKHLNGKLRVSREQVTGRLDEKPPKRWAQLTERTREMLLDFRAFRLHYFGRVTPPFQQDAADELTSSDAEELVILWPPGYGKSLMISHDYPIWRMLRARAFGDRFASLLMSESEAMGRRFLGQIRGTLEHNRPLREDHGWFRPDDMGWTTLALHVDGFERGEQKEATFEAAGAKSQINGLRMDLIVGDDLVSKLTARNQDLQAELEEWLHDQVESRLDPGGTLAIVGTRWNPHDLYGRLANKVDDDGEPFYRTIRFRAHDMSKCPGPKGPHLGYPQGCMLWPERTEQLVGVKRRRRAEINADVLNAPEPEPVGV